MNEQEDKRYMQVANDLNLLTLDNSAGVVYWKPAGLRLYEKLKSFIRKEHESRGYLEVKTPSIVGDQLFEQSGHLEKYRQNMFVLDAEEYSNYVLRPMSCPNHIVIYQSELRSYKNLPLPIFEFGEVFRNEPSGSLQVLFRQRQFCQDDSHVFVNKDNLASAISNYLLMAQSVYKMLGFEEVKYDISLRPEQRFGSDDDWDVAEEALRNACKMHDIEFTEFPGDGAFYGPKIELKVKDKLGRSWQLGTLQLDYVLPKRFNLHYVDETSAKETPIILHHAVLGSLERMIGILLESFGTNLPDFLHPYPTIVVPISAKSSEYAQLVAQKLGSSVDNNDEPLGKKLAMWRNKGVINIYVVGEQEAQYYAEHNIMQAILNDKNGKRLVELK